MKHRFVVTDSAASVVFAQLQESGLGRWDVLRLEGLSFHEYLRMLSGSDEATDEEILRRYPNALERYLARGGFPEHALEENTELVRHRLRADIADRAILRDLLRFGVEVERIKRLFVYLVQESGAIFDPGKCASALQADPRSVQSWISLLQSTHLIDRLERHPVPPSARLKEKPRLFAADHGFVVAFAAVAHPQQDAKVRSRVFETVVFRHLRELVEDPGLLGFYRSAESSEADFVMKRNGQTVVVEVTSSRSPDSKKREGLYSVGKRLKTKNLLIVHGGVVREVLGDLRLVPLQEFLLDPAATLQRSGTT